MELVMQIQYDEMTRYHAAGAVFLEKHGKTFEDPNIEKLFKPDFDEMLTEPMLVMIDMGCKMFLDYITKEGKDEETIGRSRRMLEDRGYMATLREGMEEWQERSFQVFLHGDSRANNYMFRYASDGATPVDVKFVDFQSAFR